MSLTALLDWIAKNQGQIGIWCAAIASIVGHVWQFRRHGKLAAKMQATKAENAELHTTIHRAAVKGPYPHPHKHHK